MEESEDTQSLSIIELAVYDYLMGYTDICPEWYRTLKAAQAVFVPPWVFEGHDITPINIGVTSDWRKKILAALKAEKRVSLATNISTNKFDRLGLLNNPDVGINVAISMEQPKEEIKEWLISMAKRKNINNRGLSL